MFLALFAAIISSCTKSDTITTTSEAEKGTLALTLVSDIDTTKADGDEVVDGDVNEDVDSTNSVDDYIITIYKDAGSGELGDTVATYQRYVEMPTYISLDEGSYVIEAKSMEQVAAGFETPYYYGKQRVEIEPLTVASAEITCTLNNVKLTVEYSDEFLAQFSSFEVMVEVKDYSLVPDGQDASVTFTADETRAAYFMVADLRVVVDGVQNDADATPYNHVFYIEGSQAQDYHKVTLDISPIGYSSFSISVDMTTNDIDQSITVPSEDEDLGESGVPEFDIYDEPTISLRDLDIDEAITISTATDIEGGAIMGDCKIPIIVDLTADAGIYSLKVTIDAPEINDLAEDMFGSLTFDLANVEAGSDLEKSLQELGLYDPLDPISGKTSHSFEITGFMGMLGFTSGYETSTSKFTIEVTDYLDNTVSKIVTINRVP